MMPQYHIAASSILAVAFYYLTNSVSASFLCFFSGFCIDIDHLLDFWLYKKRIAFSEEVFQDFYIKWDKVPVLLHSVELLIPLWSLGYAFTPVSFVVAVSAGFVLHIILDLFTNETKPLGYFLSYRLVKGFDKKFICGSRCINFGRSK